MDLLAYWRWDNYVVDLDEGAGFHFNSNQPRLHQRIAEGDSLWLVTGRPTPRGRAYPLVARLVVAAKTINAPGYKYGRFRLWGDVSNSRYFSADGPDASDLLRRLTFEPRGPMGSANVGQSLQTLRALTVADTQWLSAWAARLADEPRARTVADEPSLEAAYAAGRDALREVLASYHGGPSPTRRAGLEHALPRNRELTAELRRRYAGRCQLCAYDPKTLYGAGACEAHHIVYLSRGGEDALENLLLVCPNHHTAIHSTDAVFDYRDLQYVFPRGRREPLVLNTHLAAA
jgi:5-methylcytosine-specific restriction protein A